MFEGKKILITGGTGSWGYELTEHLLKRKPKEIRIFSRGEFAQVTMLRKFNDERLDFIIGDVRDYEAINSACEDIDYVFHLAALKHVPICEEQPLEAIKTNIKGTENLIKAAIYNEIKEVIDVSTDKAVIPVNSYGMTKAIGEKLIIHANKRQNKTKFICIRAGNVMGSNGSVIPYLIESIKNHNEVIITDRRMTRFFMTLSEAIGLLFKATEQSFGGETFIIKMPAIRIIDLAEVLIERYGNKNTRIKEIGKRPGEKIDEVLISKYEIDNVFKFTEEYYVILPILTLKGLRDYYNGLNVEKVKFEEYNSAMELFSKDQLKALLEKAKFI